MDSNLRKEPKTTTSEQEKATEKLLDHVQDDANVTVSSYNKDARISAPKNETEIGELKAIRASHTKSLHPSLDDDISNLSQEEDENANANEKRDSERKAEELRWKIAKINESIESSERRESELKSHVDAMVCNMYAFQIIGGRGRSITKRTRYMSLFGRDQGRKREGAVS